MKVLLLGDYSSFHYNLAKGLRYHGIETTLASHGDGWKNIPRDIDLKQPDKNKRLGFLYKLIKSYPKFVGYDVVQLISPNFLMTSPYLTSLYFDLIKSFNKKLFVCATGMDHIYVSYALTGKLKHSVFNIKDIKSDPYVEEIRGLASNLSLKKIDFKVSNYCDGIIATSLGYHEAYSSLFPNKTKYIPIPIDTKEFPYVNTIGRNTERVKFFLGLMKGRIVIKGANRIQNVLLELQKKWPNSVDLNIVNSIPFKKYTQLINQSHVLCDQLYASGIGINGLIALSKGLIVGGCGDDEMYEALGEYNNRPVLDLNTTEIQMLKTFEQLIENRNNLKQHAENSRQFVVDNHDSVKVAKQYLDFWSKR